MRKGSTNFMECIYEIIYFLPNVATVWREWLCVAQCNGVLFILPPSASTGTPLKQQKSIFYIYSSLSCWWKFTFLLAALQFLFCCWLRPSGVESHNFHPLKKENKTSSIWINLWTGFPKDRNWKLILSSSGSKKETRGSHGLLERGKSI